MTFPLEPNLKIRPSDMRRKQTRKSFPIELPFDFDLCKKASGLEIYCKTASLLCHWSRLPAPFSSQEERPFI